MERIAVGCFRAACMAFPAGFRDSHGAEMVEAFARALRAVHARHGPLGAMSFTIRSAADAARQGFTERTRSGVPRGHGRTIHHEGRGGMAHGLATDVRLALRSVRRAPGFSVAATLVLALGVGANATVFSAMRAAILTPSPYREPDRLVLADIMRTSTATGEASPMAWSYPKFRLLSEVPGRLIDPMAGYAVRQATLAEAGPPARVNLEVVSAGYFGLLGMDPVLGREFDAAEDDPADPGHVVVLSHDIWRSRFAGDPSVVGRAIMLGGRPMTVVGVAPVGFEGLTGAASLWIPMGVSGELISPFMVSQAQSHWFHVVGRLRDGVAFEDARDQMRALGLAVAETYPGSSPGVELGGTARRFEDVRVNPGARAAVLALLAAAMLVLLVACANLSGLLLARVLRRAHDSAVRVAVGASRWRLVRASLVESSVLAIMGGALGLGLATVGTHVMALAWPRQFLSSEQGELQAVSVDTLGVDGAVLAFGVGATLATLLLFGVLPALRASGAEVAQRLKDGSWRGRRSDRVLGLDTRAALVAAQVALALTLLLGTGLVGASVRRLLAVDLGFDPEGVVTFQYTIPRESAWSDDPVTFHESFLERVRAIPGVAGAALGVPPLGGHWSITRVRDIEGQPAIALGQGPRIGANIVSDGYVEALRIPLLDGRTFDASDGEDATPTVILSRHAAERLFPRGQAVGQRIEVAMSQDGRERHAEVIGVVGDPRFSPPDREIMPEAFYSVRDFPITQGTISLRAARDPSELLPAVRAVLRGLEPSMPIANVRTMDEIITAATGDRRIVLGLLSVFALVTVLLAATGTWGIVSYAVADRRRELGLRLALGAGDARVVRLVLGQSGRYALGGAVLGFVIFVAGSRVLDAFLYETTRVDPWVFSGGSALLLGVVFLASWLPARQATRVHPVQALKSD
jgi:predicted permease